MDRLWREYPHTTLEAAGLTVGLPAGAAGNSEAGHIHLGAGRRIYSDREENWDRVEKTYRMLVHGEGKGIRKLAGPIPQLLLVDNDAKDEKA